MNTPHPNVVTLHRLPQGISKLLPRGHLTRPYIGPLAFKNDRPPLAKPDRRSQFGRSSFAEHPHLIQETTVYDGHFGRNGGSSLADPVWRICPLTELIILARAFLKARGRLESVASRFQATPSLITFFTDTSKGASLLLRSLPSQRWRRAEAALLSKPVAACPRVCGGAASFKTAAARSTCL